MNAFPNATGSVFCLTPELLDRGCRAASASPRKRIIQPVHRAQSDPVQRVVNFLQPGTYIRPHAHLGDGQVEFIHVIQGRVGFLVFSHDGRLEATYDLPAGPLGTIDIEAGVWHTLVCLAPDTIITEAKLGPYDPEQDKNFAAWAPAEADSEAAAAVRSFAAHFDPAGSGPPPP